MNNLTPIYLSCLNLNLRDRHVQIDLADCHAFHCRVLSAFPKLSDGAAKARARFGVLYRTDIVKRNGAMQLKLLVQSNMEPDWSSLPSGYLLEEGAEPKSECKEVSASYAYVADRMKLMFRLRANPTRKIDTKTRPDGTKRNGKRVDLRRADDQIEWLRRKGAECGFRLLSVRINDEVPNLRANPEGRVFGRRTDQSAEGEGRRKLTFASVLFEGELVVTDRDKFSVALANGIGSGKAYGFGLLSVARALS